MNNEWIEFNAPWNVYASDELHDKFNEEHPLPLQFPHILFF